MRIGELAHAAETTVRAVRHYHRLGLMPEPARTPAGYRVYTVADLVRLLRIRWLARSGVPLGSVATVLGGRTGPPDAESESDLTADLESLLAAADAEIRTLQVKRNSLAEMLRRHRNGEPLSPLPKPIADAFDELIDGEHDPRVRALFETERDGCEMLALTGQAPATFFDALHTLLEEPRRRHEVVAAYRRFGGLAGRDPRDAADEITAVVDDMVALFRAVPGLIDTLEAWAVEAAPVVEPNRDAVAEVLPDPAQQAAAREILRRLATPSPR
ncbi:MerR family transcriptional regulator [Rhodococcus sp. NPDC047139]|uniref:MerR family transcriptional regulator n=1 Tax=Rhodococcus sp. NPDC047139 TaxID=3155141 RepID=UPI0033CA42BF